MNISKVWGIGSNLTKFFYKYHIHTISQFIRINDDWIKNNISIAIWKTQQELKGKQYFLLDDTPIKKKSFCTSRTFKQEIKSFDKLKQAISTYTMNCAKKLREQKSYARYISVFIKTNPFSSRSNQNNKHKGILLDVATSDSIELVSIAIKLLKSIYNKHYVYKRAGVVVENIISSNEIQMHLFDKIPDREDRKKIMKAIDTINRTMGKEKIKIASQGIENNWQMKQTNLSPCYTTRWEDILSIY